MSKRATPPRRTAQAGTGAFGWLGAGSVLKIVEIVATHSPRSTTPLRREAFAAWTLCVRSGARGCTLGLARGSATSSSKLLSSGTRSTRSIVPRAAFHLLVERIPRPSQSRDLGRGTHPRPYGVWPRGPESRSGALTWAVGRPNRGRGSPAPHAPLPWTYRSVDSYDSSCSPGRARPTKDLEIIVLRHEHAVLCRQVKRPQFRAADRAVLAAACACFAGSAGWPSSFGRKLCFDGTAASSPGRRGGRRPRRPALAREVRELILRLARENPGGATCGSAERS